MQRFTQTLLLSAILTVFTGIAYAASTDEQTTHPGGWHVGATSGMSLINTLEAGGSYDSTTQFVYSYTSHNRSYAGGIYAGYDWALSDRWALGVEGGYQDLGHSKASYNATTGILYGITAKNHLQALNLLITEKYWLTNHVDIFSKLGIAYEQLIRKVDCVSGTCSVALPASNYANETRYYLNPELQLGLGWQLANNWNINLAYQRIFGESTSTLDNAGRGYGSTLDNHINPTVDSVLLGVDYQFTQIPTLSDKVNSHPSEHASGWHVGVNNGLSVINTYEPGGSESSTNTAYNLNNHSYTGGIYLGYDWLLSNRWNLGVEGGYQDLGTSKWRINSTNPNAGGAPYGLHAKTHIQAMSMLLTAKYWLTDRFDMFTKLGVAYETLTRDLACDSGNCSGLLPSSNSVSSTHYYLNPELQAGLGWNIADNWNMNLAYQRIIGAQTNAYNQLTSQYDFRNNPSIDSLLLGVDYQFASVPNLSSLVAMHPGGWHVGVLNGLSIIHTQEPDAADYNSSTRYKMKDRSYTGGAYVGYDWILSDRWNVGVEAGYQDLGIHQWWSYNSAGAEKDTKSKEQAQALNLLFTAKYWLTNRVDVFTKLGAAYEWLTRESSCETATCENAFYQTRNVKGTRYYLNPELQAGLGWQVADNWNVSVAYQQIMTDGIRTLNPITNWEDISANPTIESILLGLDYQFSTVPTLASVTMEHPGGWYVGVANGLSVINTHEFVGSEDNSTAHYKLNNRSYAGSIYAGYDWALNNRWSLGVEGGYQELGQSKFSFTDTSDTPYTYQAKNQIRALDTLLTAKYWLTNRTDLFAKLGVAVEQLIRKTACSSGTCGGSFPAASTTKATRYYLNPEAQLGLGWQVADNWNVNLAYQRVLSDDVQIYNGQTGQYDTHINPTINSLLLGVDYQFISVSTLANVTMEHTGGWYVGAANGLSIINTNEKGSSEDNVNNSYNFNNRSYTGGVYVGHDWALNNRWNLGIEGGYQDLGQSDWSYNYNGTSTFGLKAQNRIHAVNTLFTAKYWFSNRMDVFSKLGLVYEQLKRDVNCESGDCSAILPPSGTANETRYYLNPELQAGLGWQVADNWNINVAYQRVFSGNTSVTNPQSRSNPDEQGNTAHDTHINPTIDSLLFGVDYRF